MKCPKCSGVSKVLSTRRDVYRRRECVACANRFSTVEVSVEEKTDARSAVFRMNMLGARIRELLDEV